MLLLLSSACTGAAPDTGNPPTRTVEYYSGESQYYNNDGRAMGDPSEVILRRTLDPANATLEEVVVTVDGEDVATYTLLGEVDGDAGSWTFAFDDAYGTLEGDGEFLEGEMWAWTAWASTSTYVSGTYEGAYVTSNDTVDDDGLVADKAFFLADDEPQGTIVETLAFVAASDWDARHDALLGE